MSKHTPGPWTGYKCIEPSRAWTINASPKNVVCGISGGAMIDKSDEELEANARLIAAAPDLLDALRCCLAMIEGEGLDELHGDLAEVVRAAIARAEGRDA
jgi:hypothetical protein